MKKGFSLIEILIVIAIIGIISTIFVYSLRQNIQEKKLNGIVNTIVAKLQEAKNLSQSGKDGQNYGVKFNSDSYVTFVGANYVSTNSDNVIFPVDDAFKIENTIPGVDDSLVFSKIFGEINFNQNVQIANIIVTEKNDPSNTTTIRVGRLGDISVIK